MNSEPAKTPRFLVLTLCCDEPQTDDCLRSVADQVGVEIEHKVFRNLPNVEAHKALYGMIMKSELDFDFFLKLDADMVLNRPSALREIADLLHRERDVMHLMTWVNDHYTGAPMMGVHVFRPGVRWNLDNGSTLFVDPNPTFDGRSKVTSWSELSRYVEHAPNPSDEQAFHFGWHRTLKYAVGRANGQGHASFQAQILIQLERNYRATQLRPVGLALIASGLVLRRELLGESGDKADVAVAKHFRIVSKLSDAEIATRINSERWLRRYKIRRFLARARPLTRIKALGMTE